MVSSGALTDGKFFVRKRGPTTPNEYVLTVVYKGRPTHHLMKQSAAGQPFTINGKPLESTTLADVCGPAVPVTYPATEPVAGPASHHLLMLCCDVLRCVVGLRV